jgi:hypothetical protein
MKIWKVNYYSYVENIIQQKYFYSEGEANEFSNNKRDTASIPELIKIYGESPREIKVKVEITKEEIKKKMIESLEEILETLKGE